jgi:hypothetical protein
MNMKIDIISGSYPARDAIDLLTSIVGAKVRFHENRIHSSMTEEDMEMRERSIQHLQHEMVTVRRALECSGGLVDLHGAVRFGE